MKRAHAAIFLLFVVDKLVFFFFEMEYDGIVNLASEHEKYKTKSKKLVPKKNAFNLL